MPTAEDTFNMEWILYMLMPFVTGGIGWLTNWLAIKMLFRPRKVWNILGWKCQGIIPKRQGELAEQCAIIIERELLQQHMLEDMIRSLDVGPIVETKIKSLIAEKLGAKLKALPMIGAFVNDASIGMIQEIAAKEMAKEAEGLMGEIAEKASEQFPIKEIIREKIMQFDLDKLEEIVMNVARKEFKTIEYLGAILGFIIGVFQILFLLLIKGY